ncbi:MAG: hypothetical protein AAF975_01005, partial [Spirochaetota bacterium]
RTCLILETLRTLAFRWPAEPSFKARKPLAYGTDLPHSRNAAHPRVSRVYRRAERGLPEGQRWP